MSAAAMIHPAAAARVGTGSLAWKMRRAPSLAPSAIRSRPPSSVASHRSGAVRVVAMAPPRKAAPKKDVVLTPSHISARDGDGPYPLDSGGAGWDAVELYDLTGLCWSFTTPSSTEGRRIVKAACERKGMALKGYSDWRKEDWAAMAAKAGVDLRESFAVVAGMRGFRVCWAPHGVALMYVPGVRRFYTVADIANGAADVKADRPAAEVVKAFEAVGRVKSELADAFAVATDPAAAAAAARAANSGQSPRDASPTGDASGEGAQTTNAYSYPNPRSCVAKWCVGIGVDAASLYAEYAVGFDFHGPAGAVSRALIAALAADAGTPLPADADAEWVKKDWLDAMERLGVSYGNTHAALTAAGRSWKVCWVEDALESGCPAVLVWAPERNAYYTLGSLAAAGGSSPAPVEAVIRAVVAVARSTPAPPGLKRALTMDCDFLTLLGRKPANANAPVSVGTTGGAKAAEAADAAAALAGRTLLSSNDDAAKKAEKEVGTDGNVSAKSQIATDEPVATVTTPFTTPVTTPVTTPAPDVSEADGTRADLPGDDAREDPEGDASENYFRPAPELDDFEWEDSREGMRRRVRSRESDDGTSDGYVDVSDGASMARSVFDAMSDGSIAHQAPGFEDVAGMEGFVAEGQAETVGQGEFFSRSAGYLSFVDGSWTKEDLAREMGLERDRDEPPVTPRDFPDLSKMPRQSEGGAELAEGGALDEDFKELVPPGLPRDFDAYHPMRMKNVDYLVAKTNDGRLDLREIMMARRSESDGRFVGEARRVDTSAVLTLNLAPAYYHEVPWTERHVVKEQKHSPDGGPAEYDTRVANTVRTYLVHARQPMDARHAHDRQLDFTKPVLTLDDDGELAVVSVRGAEVAGDRDDWVLVIKDGECVLEDPAALASWEEVAHAWEVDEADASAEKGGQELHEDFLKEVEMDYVPDDTPEVDNF